MHFLNTLLPNCRFQGCSVTLLIPPCYAILGCPLLTRSSLSNPLKKGLAKLVLNDGQIYSDLENNWAVVAEAIQTILRREKFPNPYEALKDLTRGKDQITKATIHQFIEGLKVPATIKKELKAITPHNYTGVHPKF